MTPTPATKRYPDNYQTFAELAEYARQRAKVSIRRRGHQEAAYWIGIMRWAEALSHHTTITPESTYRHCCQRLEWLKTQDLTQAARIRDAALWYARAVHMRKMLINQRHHPKRLSLDWLRELEAKL